MKEISILSPALADFWLKSKIHSNPDYPFLAPQYSPNSCVLCVDISEFIVERLKENDTQSVSELLSLIFGKRLNTREIINTNFNRFFCSSDQFLLEVKALLLILLKHGMILPRLLSHEDNIYLAFALSCHDIAIKDDIYILTELCNRYMEAYRRDSDVFWAHEFPHFSILPPIPTMQHNQIAKEICSIPINCRLALYCLRHMGCYDVFATRSLGSHKEQTFPLLVESGLVTVSKGTLDVLMKKFTKNELIELCESNAIRAYKSWTKSAISQILLTKIPEICDDACYKKRCVNFAPGVGEAIDYLSERAKVILPLIHLASFAFKDHP